MSQITDHPDTRAESGSLSPFAPEWLDDPFPLYARLREMGPAVWVDGKYWAITTAAAVHDALRDNERLMNANPLFEKGGRELGAAFQWFKETVVQLDDPEHGPQRRLLSAPFTPARVGNYVPMIHDIVDECLDHLESRGPRCDFAEDFAHPFPLTMFTRLLGIPDEDRAKIVEWNEPLAGLLGRSLDRHKADRANEAAGKLLNYLSTLADERAANPGDDHLSVLLQAEEEGRFLSRRQLIVQTMALLLGSYDTTAHTLATGIALFDRHPDQWQLLCEQPDLADNAIEEILRYDAVTTSATRTVREDFDFHGRRFKAGQSVTVFTASANRDPATHDDPDRFDITREKIKHFSFGGGRHFCIGAGMARHEASIALRKIAERFPSIRICGTPTPFRTGFFRGYTQLPVEL